MIDILVISYAFIFPIVVFFIIYTPMIIFMYLKKFSKFLYATFMPDPSLKWILLFYFIASNTGFFPPEVIIGVFVLYIIYYYFYNTYSYNILISKNYPSKRDEEQFGDLFIYTLLITIVISYII